MKNESVRRSKLILYKINWQQEKFYLKMVGKYAERHKLAWEISNLKSLEICPFHHKEFFATITEHLLKKLWILSPLDQKFINHFKN